MKKPFALITDRMYKNKLQPGDLDRFTEEEITEMKRICKVRRDEIERLYAVAEDVSI